MTDKIWVFQTQIQLIFRNNQDTPDLIDKRIINEVMKKNEQICNLFSKISDENNAMLYKCVKTELERGTKPILNFKTGRNSLESFILLITSFRNSIIDFNHLVSLEDTEF